MIQHIHDITGATNLYAVIANAAGQRWRVGSTNAFENFTVASWGQYAISLSESPAGSFRYTVAVPAGINTAMALTIFIYERVGGSPIVSDTLLATDVIQWSGIAMAFPNTVAPATPANVTAAVESIVSQIGAMIPTENGFLVPLTIKDNANRILEGVEVIITSTNASDENDIVAKSYSNGAGKVEFPLEAGTYYLWRHKRQYTFLDPVRFIVDEEGAVTFPV